MWAHLEDQYHMADMHISRFVQDLVEKRKLGRAVFFVCYVFAIHTTGMQKPIYICIDAIIYDWRI